MRVLVAVLLVGACAADGGPRLSSVSPESPARGAVVEIDGQGFCGTSGNCANVSAFVQLGSSSPFIDVVPMTWTATAVTGLIPDAAPLGPTPLVMTVNGLASNELDLDIQLGGM